MNILLVSMLITVMSVVKAQVQHTVFCEGTGISKPSIVLPPPSFMYQNQIPLENSNQLQIDVNYSTFSPPELIDAFEYAVKIWEHLLVGTSNVKCLVNFEPITTQFKADNYFTVKKMNLIK